MTLTSRAFGRLAKLPPALARDIAIEESMRIACPDGVVLLADRFAPKHPDHLAPILLARTPYGRRGLFRLIGRVMAERGYQVVIVSSRGTFGSGGEWLPFRNEEADGHAVFDWLSTQPWFTPTVALWGGSYFGLTQWAVAAEPPEWVKAMTPAVTCSWFRDMIYPGDALALESMLTWIGGLEYQESGKFPLLRAILNGRKRLPAAYASVPLADADTALVGHHVDYFQDWLAHDEPGDPWWAPVDFGRSLTKTPPANFVAGWYDLFLPYQLEDFKKLRDAGREARLLVGPWTHGSPGNAFSLLTETLDWADVHLRGARTHRASNVRVFVMGAKRWIDLSEWPPPATDTAWYLQPDGGLRATPAESSAPDSYRYDPADPTPSVGGASLDRRAGARDNRRVEARQDVLTYTSPPLTDDVTVIGEVSARLHVRSSLDYTDFFVRLCDVAPNGRSVNISDGIRRLRPGACNRDEDGIAALEIAMFPTAHMFRRGHRIRLQVSSGAHPLYARNLGNGEPLGKATTLVAADQQVLHDPAHQSSVVLPVTASSG
jgi:uncharacterized protein